MFLKGVLPDGLGAFSRGPEPTAVPPIRSSSSPYCSLRFFWILQKTKPRAPIMMAPPTPTTTPMMIFLSEEDTPLEPELLSALREGAATGVEVVVITLAMVDPSLVAYEVMVFVTGVWVVVVLWDEVVLSLPALVAEVGSVLEVVAATVGSEVEEGSAEVVASVVESVVVASVEVEEVEVVVGSAVVVGSVEVSSEVVEEDDEVVDVVSGASEVEDEVV